MAVPNFKIFDFTFSLLVIGLPRGGRYFFVSKKHAIPSNRDTFGFLCAMEMGCLNFDKK